MEIFQFFFLTPDRFLDRLKFRSDIAKYKKVFHVIYLQFQIAKTIRGHYIGPLIALSRNVHLLGPK